MWEEIGNRIKTLRCEKELTQTQFGELIGISSQYVGKIANGQILSVEQIIIICEKTGVTMDYIVLGTVDPLANTEFLNDFTGEQIEISLEILKLIAKLIKTKNGNELLIKEIMRRHVHPML
jgi:transcriptional regulator with XRE-family HTH domain